VLLDLVDIASEGEKASTNSEGIIEVGGAKRVENSNVTLFDSLRRRIVFEVLQ